MFCSTKLKILNKTILARWPAARPRCIPPAGGSFRALNPFQSQQTVSPVKHSRETSLSLHPSINGLSRPLKPLAPYGRCITNQGSVPATPNAPMTISWRPGREHSRYPSLEPSHRPKSLRSPLEPGPTLRGLDAAILPKMDHSLVFSPRQPDSSDLEECPPTNTEPCKIGHSIDRRHFSVENFFEANCASVGCVERKLNRRKKCRKNNDFPYSNVYPLVTLLAMKDAGLRIRLQRELRESFLEACKAQDKPAAQVIREFMREYVEEHEAKAEASAKENN